MSSPLHRTFAARADRAVGAPDIDDVLHLIEQRAGERRHRRRTRIAAAGSSLAVVALVVGGSVVLSHDDSPRTAHSLSSQHQPAAAVPDGLVAAPPAPAAAPLSLGLLPPGWTYEGAGASAVTYIAPGATPGDPNHFIGKIAVMSDQRYPSEPAFDITIAGRPGRIEHSSGGTGVWIQVPDDSAGLPVEVIIEVPDSTGLSQQQILELADSIDIRRTEPHGVG